MNNGIMHSASAQPATGQVEHRKPWAGCRALLAGVRPVALVVSGVAYHCGAASYTANASIARPKATNRSGRLASSAFEKLLVARVAAALLALAGYVMLDTQGGIAVAFDNVNLTSTAIPFDKNGRAVHRIVSVPDLVARNTRIDREMAQ